MSREDVELVRQLHAPFDDDISAAMEAALGDTLAPDFECIFVRDDLGRASYSGIDGLRRAWLDWLAPWESYRAVVEDMIDAGDGRVVRAEGLAAAGLTS
jgi:ketosteroid isomerase-like protein